MPRWAYAPYENRTITGAVHRTMDASVPDLAKIVNFGIGLENGTHYPWSPSTPVPVEVELAVRRHYFAAITFMDAQVGKVLAALSSLGLAETTVVIFHADHGYFQGEDGEWEKKMLFENTARVPLIIYDPTNPTHRRSTELVELIDVFPTAAVLAGFGMPANLDGVSLAPLMGSRYSDYTDEERTASATKPAFTQYPRCHGTDSVDGTCLEVANTDFKFMGYSVRTQGKS